MTSEYHQIRIDANKTLHEIVQASWSGCPDEIPGLWRQIPPDLRPRIREGLDGMLRWIDKAEENA